MSFSTRQSSTVIQVGLTIYSADLCNIRSPGFLRKVTDPLTYVSVQVDNAAGIITKKTKQPTTNAMYQEKIHVVVKPTSVITFTVMSFHRNSADKMIGQATINMGTIANDYPPQIQTATIKLSLKNPGQHKVFTLEDFNSTNYPANMTLTVQISEWPQLHRALDIVRQSNNGESSDSPVGSNGGNQTNTNSSVASPVVSAALPSSQRNNNNSAQQSSERLANMMAQINLASNPVGRPTAQSNHQQNNNKKLDRNASTASSASVTSSSTAGGDNLPQHFEKRVDPNTGKIYYVDHLLRKTQWNAPEPLPSNWERRKDQNSNRVYYVDHANRRTQWEHPGENPENNNSRNQISSYMNRNLNALGVTENSAGDNASSSSNPINESFGSNNGKFSSSAQPARQISKGEGRELDYNTLKSKRRKDSLDDEYEAEYLETFEADKVDEIMGPLSADWEEKKQNGRNYYLNHTAKVSQWEDPRTLGYMVRDGVPKGWQKQFLEDGMVYYINHDRQQTAWDPWQKEGIQYTPKEYYKDHKREFKDKWGHFQGLCHYNIPEGYMKCPISRRNIFGTAYNFFMQDVLTQATDKVRSPNEYRKRLFVAFDKEEGLDYGGVSREFFYLLSHEIANPSYGLFMHSQNYSLKINPQSRLAVGEDHINRYRFVGRVVGMCLYHQRYLDVGFSLPFYKKLLGKPIKLSDIADVDEEWYTNLRYILQNDIDELFMCLDFTMNEDYFGELKTIELKPGGADIDVTDANKTEYVKLMVNYRFSRGVEEQMEAICQGIKEIIPIEWLRLFDEHDLEFALCGHQNIDIHDWRKFTIYKNCKESDKTVQFFWQWLGRATVEKRLKLLQFVTGTCRIPPDGFADLMGSNGPQRFCIEKVGKDNHHNSKELPKSHTCFNRLDLPNYTSLASLTHKLEMAIYECSTGFAVD